MKNKERRKKAIENSLKKGSKTISQLAEELNLSCDSIRNCINEMVAEQWLIRVAGWHVLKTTMVRIWGYGTEHNEPQPVRVVVRKPRSRLSVDVKSCQPQEVKYRREEMDEWLFRAKRMA